MKILFFGDIVGRIGRQAIKKVLPKLKEKYNPDLIIANVENLAHGSGVTPKTLQEVREAGVDIFTSGNHIFKKPEVSQILAEKDSVLLRPANYVAELPGTGFRIAEVGSRSVLVINLMGRVFIKDQGEFSCPFKKIDEILSLNFPKNLAAVIVDFHAEATSEKMAMGVYLDGRVSAVLGTHTHVGTIDAQVLPQGSAYVTDLGMVGPIDSIIGDDIQSVLQRFLTAMPHRLTVGHGKAMFNAVMVRVDDQTGKALSIERVYREVG